LAEDGVINAAFVAQSDGGIAFDVQKLARKLNDTRVVFGFDAVAGVVLAGNGGKAPLVARDGILVCGGCMVGVPVSAQTFDVLEGSHDHGPASFLFFQTVIRMTQKVRKMSRLRSGNGLPSARTSGKASAAANAITPRMPAHPTMKIARADGYCDCWRKMWRRIQ
jgi:hypothetical protein